MVKTTVLLPSGERQYEGRYVQCLTGLTSRTEQDRRRRQRLAFPRYLLAFVLASQDSHELVVEGGTCGNDAAEPSEVQVK